MLPLIFIIILVLMYHVYERHRMRNLPPYMEGALRMPIIGHSLMVFFNKTYYAMIEESLNKQLEKKKEFMTVRLGFWDFTVILNPEDAHFISNACLDKEPMLYNFTKPFLGDGLITATVPKWNVHRKLLNPTFNQQVLNGYLQEFNIQARELMDTIAVEAGKGPFDQMNYMVQCSLKITCATSMGISNDAEDKEVRKIFVEGMQDSLVIITHRIAKFWLHSDIIYKLTGHQAHRDLVIDKVKMMSKTILEKKRAEVQLNKSQIIDSNPGKRFKPFLEFLLELAEEGDLTDQEIADELNTFIIAGTDTLAITISKVLTCVGSYSGLQDRILDELHEVFEGSDRDVTKQDLTKLKYLDAVIKETLRVYPIVPATGRILDKEIRIKGYTLPAGSKCIFAVYAHLRHWSWGPDANKYRPERWLDGSLPSNMKGFTAFGVGKRNCIGYNFAIMGIKTILANFLRRYSIKSDISKMVEEFYITVKPISGHEISIEKRQCLPIRRPSRGP